MEPMADRESLAFPTKLLMLPTMPELEPGGGAYAEAACTCEHSQHCMTLLSVGCFCTSGFDWSLIASPVNLTGIALCLKCRELGPRCCSSG